MGYQFTNPYYSIGDNPCMDKVSFLDKKQAEAARVQAKWEHDNQELTVYLCDKCSLYHLSTVSEAED